MKSNPLTVGLRIKNIRETRGVNQKEFAKLINATVPAVSNWENGRSLPNNERLKRIAELGGIAVNELLYGSPKEFAYNVLIKELDSDTPLKKIIYQAISDDSKIPDSETHAKAISLVTERFNDIFTTLVLTIVNLPNESINDIFNKPDMIIRTAIRFFSIKEIKQFPEYNEALKKIINQTHDLDTNFSVGSIEEIEQRLLRKGMNEAEAHKEAINRYFNTKAFSAVQDLEDKLEEIYKEYQTQISPALNE